MSLEGTKQYVDYRVENAFIDMDMEDREELEIQKCPEEDYDKDLTEIFI